MTSPPAPQVDLSARGRRIDFLDGLRAVAIALVVIGHLSIAGWALPPWLALSLGNSDIGVCIFFVVSGFLITRLLLDERERSGDIRLGRFFRRRAYRIFPAFYFQLATLAALSWWGWIHIRPADFAAAGFYYWSYLPGASQILAPTWTLAVEEQFYLLWPLWLRWRRPAGGARFALAALALSPLVRVGVYFALPHWRARIPIMLPTRADMLLFGAALAFGYSNPRLQAWLQAAYRHYLPVASVLFLLVISPRLYGRWQGAYWLTVGWSAEGLAIVVILAWLLQHPRSAPGRVLAAPPLAHLGRISYSLYLWQQLFLLSPLRVHLGLPLSLLAALLTAEFSYQAVERPFLRIRERRAAAAARAAVSLAP